MISESQFRREAAGTVTWDLAYAGGRSPASDPKAQPPALGADRSEQRHADLRSRPRSIAEDRGLGKVTP